MFGTAGTNLGRAAGRLRERGLVGGEEEVLGWKLEKALAGIEWGQDLLAVSLPGGGILLRDPQRLPDRCRFGFGFRVVG